MAALYAENAEFSDEVFVGLRGKEIGGMWTMLATRSKDLRVSYEILSVQGSTPKFFGMPTTRFQNEAPRSQCHQWHPDGERWKNCESPRPL